MATVIPTGNPHLAYQQPTPPGGSIVGSDGNSGVKDTTLAPAQPADQFGLAPAVAPSTSAAAVAPAETATSNSTGVSPTWGKEIPYLFGTCQVLGNALWTGKPEYIKGTDGTDNYVVDFAVVFGRPGPNSAGGSIRNIYFDAVPVITLDRRTKELTIAGDFDYTFYDGTQEDDAIDPLIDAQESPYTPAFKGLIYLVVSQYVIATGKKELPVVVGEIHLDEIATPSGGLVEPMAIANPRIVAPGYDFRERTWWDSDRYCLYCMYPTGSFGVPGPIRCDVFDTNSRAFLYQFYIEDSADYFDRDYEISKRGDFLWYAHGYTDIYLCRLSDGKRVFTYNSPVGGIVQDFHLDKPVGGCDEIAVIPTFGRKVDVAERRGVGVTSAAIWDFDDIGTGFSTSNAAFGFAGVLDYSTMNCDQNNFTIVYCLMEQAGSGYIGRIIHTSGTVQAGVAYLTDPDTNAKYAQPVMTGKRIDLMHHFDGYAPYYIWVADNGRRIYALARLSSSGTSESYIFAFDTFWQNNNSQTNPRKATDTVVDLNKFELVYAKKLAGPVGTPNKGSQIRRAGQNKVACVGNYGQSVVTIDLRSGRSRNHIRGDWRRLPELGDFDYGEQAMPGTVIWDPDTSSIFYTRMASYTDNPGRLYLRNSVPAARPTYRLADAFRDLSVLAGYTADQVDVTGMDGPEEYITGMALNQGVEYQDLINQLAAAFRVEITETPNFGLRFRKRHSIVVDGEVYPEGQLLPVGGGDGSDDGHVIDLNYAAANQVPNILQIAYVDPDQQYLVGIAEARRAIYPHVTAAGKTIVQISVPIVMTADRAQYFAGTALFDMWAGAVTVTITGVPKFVQYECGDNLKIYFYTGRVLFCKIIGMTINGDRSVTMTLSAIKTNLYVPQSQITEHKP